MIQITESHHCVPDGLVPVMMQGFGEPLVSIEHKNNSKRVNMFNFYSTISSINFAMRTCN